MIIHNRHALLAFRNGSKAENIGFSLYFRSDLTFGDETLHILYKDKHLFL